MGSRLNHDQSLSIAGGPSSSRCRAEWCRPKLYGGNGIAWRSFDCRKCDEPRPLLWWLEIARVHVGFAALFGRTLGSNAFAGNPDGMLCLRWLGPKIESNGVPWHCWIPWRLLVRLGVADGFSMVRWNTVNAAGRRTSVVQPRFSLWSP